MSELARQEALGPDVGPVRGLNQGTLNLGERGDAGAARMDELVQLIGQAFPGRDGDAAAGARLRSDEEIDLTLERVRQGLREVVSNTRA